MQNNTTQGRIHRRRITVALIVSSMLLAILVVYAALRPFIETAWLIDELMTDGHVSKEPPESEILHELFRANPTFFSGTQQ